MAPDALVLDGSQRAALAVVRSLGRRGLRVWVASDDAEPLAAASRWCVGRLRLPSPREAAGAYAAAVDEFAAAHPDAIIFPITDVSLTALFALSNCEPRRLACAGRPAYEAVSDKGRLVELAAALGVPVPPTVLGEDRRACIEATASMSGPIVLKPARSWYLANDRLHPTAVEVHRDREAAIARLRSAEWMDHMACLVQKFVTGHGAGAFTLFGGDGPVAWFGHRRLREKPPSGGVSVLSESILLEDSLRDASDRLLRAANWFGPAMIEFRIADDGTAYLMEINGRFWGSLQLAIDAGIDFPWLLYRIMRGEDPAPALNFRTGRRLRWLLGDFDSLLIYLRDRSVPRSHKWRRLVAFLNVFSPATRLEVLRWSDPRPFAREARHWLRDVL